MKQINDLKTAFAFVYACVDMIEESPADLFGDGESPLASDFINYLLTNHIVDAYIAEQYAYSHNSVMLYDSYEEEYSDQVRLLTGDNIIVYGDDDDNKVLVLYAALLMVDDNYRNEMIQLYKSELDSITMDDVIRYTKYMPSFPIN